MTPEILPLLRCPRSGSKLELIERTSDQHGHTYSGCLVSEDGAQYPIVNGIPRFTEGTPQGSVKSFGDEWNYFNFTSFRAHWLNHFVANTFGTPDVFAGKTIVDAGGGSGAQTLWMLEHGAKHVIMLELSDSVDDVVHRNLAPSGFRNYDVIQCSIDNPPIRSGSIEGMVICHNVIQHTPSVEGTARRLFQLVAPGSEFVFNCYPRNDQGLLRALRFRLNDLARSALCRAPFAVRLAYARTLGLLRLVPVLGWTLEKLMLCMQGDVPRERRLFAHLKHRYDTTVLNTFDWFGAHTYQHYVPDLALATLVTELQPDAAKVHNLAAYFSRPQPPGIALRLTR